MKHKLGFDTYHDIKSYWIQHSKRHSNDFSETHLQQDQEKHPFLKLYPKPPESLEGLHIFLYIWYITSLWKVYIHEQLRRQKLFTNSFKASQKLFPKGFKARNYFRTASKPEISHEQLQSQKLFPNSFKARNYSRTFKDRNYVTWDDLSGPTNWSHMYLLCLDHRRWWAWRV